MFGARAVLKSVVEEFPTADISISIVWIQMPGFSDNPQSAIKIAQTIKDPRVRHFYDPQATHLAGKAFAKNLLTEGRGPAWDIYFFYDKGLEWTDLPPSPSEWMHQLGGGRRADAARFHGGEDLVTHLHQAMHTLTGEDCKSQ